MKCEYCGKDHDGNWGSGRFCCKSCAVAFSNKKRGPLSEETRLKIANTLQQIAIAKGLKPHKISLRTKNKTKEKTVYCTVKIKKCKICGREYEYIKGRGDKCQNPFCLEHNPQHFGNLIKYFTFDATKLGTPEVEIEFNRVRSMLYDLYWNQNKSSTEIAEMFGYKSTVTNIPQKFFKGYLNIPVKSVGKATRENLEMGRWSLPTVPNQYKAEWHTTWNGKEVYVRSSYELDYAKELDEQQIDYEMETLRIKYWDSQRNEFRCAVPDFYIPSQNLIVEIKSNFTFDEQNMKDKQKEYIKQGYNFKLVLEHKEYKM